MFAPPISVMDQFDAVLRALMIPASLLPDYKKWLRYYLDFCAKYPVELNCASGQEQLFSEKLRQKNQNAEQRKQADQAIKLYIGMLAQAGDEGAVDTYPSAGGEVARPDLLADTSSGQSPQTVVVKGGSSHYCEAGYQLKSSSPEWDAVLETMAGEIKVRHYS